MNGLQLLYLSFYLFVIILKMLWKPEGTKLNEFKIESILKTLGLLETLKYGKIFSKGEKLTWKEKNTYFLFLGEIKGIL